MDADAPTSIAERFLRAFAAGDFEAMRGLLADDVRASITNAEGGIDVVEGADEYLSRIEAMDLPAVDFTLEPTQVPVPVGSDRALAMVEVRARKGERTLHNYAAHLLRVAGGRITEWQMVDAKPSESDRFWA